MERYDVIIIGAGPAGIFTAVELFRKAEKKPKVLMVDEVGRASCRERVCYVV